MATEIETGSAQTAAAASAAISPDPITAEILRRHAAGEKLQPVEYGKLGAFKARLKAAQGGKPVGRPRLYPAPGAPLMGSGLPEAAPRAAPGADSGQAPPDSGGVAPIDPALIRRTTEAVLKTCDGIARTWLEGEARKAGADTVTAKSFGEAAALQSGPRELMVETSPEVLAALGVDASNYPMAAFLSGLGVWSGSLLLAVSRLRQLQAERLRSQAPAKAEAPSAGNGAAGSSKAP